MVKIETTYICPVCGARYDSLKYAEACEQSHPKDLRIKGYGYSEGMALPNRIIIATDDGREARYDLY